MRQRLTLPRLLAAGIILIVHAAAEPALPAEPAPPPDSPPVAARLVEALAESIHVRTSVGPLRVLSREADAVRIPLGSRTGIRSWSVVTLVTAGGGAWTGVVRDAGETETWLGPAEGQGEPPAAGASVRARLNMQRIALARPREEAPVDDARLGSGFPGETGRRLEELLVARYGFALIDLPAFPAPGEGRSVAADAGADLLVDIRLEAAPDGGAVRARAGLEEPRRNRAIGEVRIEISPGAPPRTADPAAPPPGTRHAFTSAPVPGPLLDLFSRRWIWSDLHAVFVDRIETWRMTPEGLAPQAVHDLSVIWPVEAPTRWPVATVLPVNTYFTLDREESKVNYSLCSNQRPRYLTLNADRRTPDSLYFAVSDGPLDSLSGCTEGCFQRVDRVSRPPEFARPEELPATAVARLTLEELVRGPSGQALRTDLGRFRTKRAAVLYYDEPSATLWASLPDTAWRLPGTFGSEMDEFRAGREGDPGFVITGGRATGPDHLEYWVLAGGRLTRAWRGPAAFGPIVALSAGDRDGDERDDLVFGEWVPEGDGWSTRVHYFSSRPSGGVAP